MESRAVDLMNETVCIQKTSKQVDHRLINE